MYYCDILDSFFNMQVAFTMQLYKVIDKELLNNMHFIHIAILVLMLQLNHIDMEFIEMNCLCQHVK